MTENRDRLQFVVHVISGPWISLCASFLIMASVGGVHLFGTYSGVIKTSLAYDQTTLNLIGFSKELGGNIGIFSGLIAEVTPTWFVLLMGSSMNFVGYFFIWLVVTQKIAEPAVWQMCMYMCIASNSLNFANTGLLVTGVKNFTENRGVLLGILKGFNGLSGAVTTQIYLALYGNDPKSLILLISWLPAAISLVFVYAVRVMNVVSQPNDVKRLYNFLYVSVVLAIFLMIMTITQKLVAIPRAGYAASATLVCGLLLFPFVIVFREELLLWNQKKLATTSPLIVSDSNQTWLEPSSSAKEQDNSTKSWLNKPERGEDYTILQAVFSIDMLLLFLSTASGLGSGLTAFDNFGQIGESLEYPNKTINTFISLVSIWNYLGRVFGGLVSEKLVIKYKFPRPLVLSLVLFLSCTSNLLVAFPIPGSLYVVSVMIGFSIGSHYTMLSAIISELFGLKHFAALFNIGQLTSPLGSYILNVKITGALYDREALKELSRKNILRSSTEELTCRGSHCYRLSFIILAAASCFGAFASLLSAARTRNFYKTDIYNKFRQNADEAELGF